MHIHVLVTHSIRKKGDSMSVYILYDAPFTLYFSRLFREPFQAAEPSDPRDIRYGILVSSDQSVDVFRMPNAHFPIPVWKSITAAEHMPDNLDKVFPITKSLSVLMIPLTLPGSTRINQICTCLMIQAGLPDIPCCGNAMLLKMNTRPTDENSSISGFSGSDLLSLKSRLSRERKKMTELILTSLPGDVSTEVFSVPSRTDPVFLRDPDHGMHLLRSHTPRPRPDPAGSG